METVDGADLRDWHFAFERRAGPDWNAPAVGYIGMDPADQDRVRRGVGTALMRLKASATTCGV